MHTYSTSRVISLALIFYSALAGATEACNTTLALIRVPFQESGGNSLPLSAEQRILENRLEQIHPNKTIKFLDSEGAIFSNGLDSLIAKWMLQLTQVGAQRRAAYPLSKLAESEKWDYVVFDINLGGEVKRSCGPGCQKVSLSRVYFLASARDGKLTWKAIGSKEQQTASTDNKTILLNALITDLSREIVSKMCVR